MVDVWELLVQFCDQEIGLLFFEPHRPDSNPSAHGGLPADRVRFHVTCRFHEIRLLGPNCFTGMGYSFFSGSSVTRHSVVKSNPAMDAAFCKAARVTFFGSTT